MRTRKHQHHEISDALVVTAIVTLGTVVFATILLALTWTPTAAAAPTTPTQQHVSSCWRVPYQLQYPTELQCALEEYAARTTA